MAKKIKDVIDHLVGTSLPIRQRRPVTYEQIQKSYDALFHPQNIDNISLKDRFSIALFVAVLHQNANIITFYQQNLNEFDVTLADNILKLASTVLTKGPYGHYPDGPLVIENTDGLIWEPQKEQIAFLDPFIAPALVYAHQIIFHPRDAKKEDFTNLIATGWQPKDLVTLSQLIAYLTFQIRLVIGLQVLNNSINIKGNHNAG